MFFFWGFGTGGLWLVRPLFAYEIGGSFLLVAAISSVSAAPRIVTGPAVGYLVDRFGRRPFIIIGALTHITALVGDFFVQSYLAFFLLEALGGAGIATWMTSGTALLADNTTASTRGRAVALRETSMRVGLLTGPIIGGVIAGALGLRYVFLFIAATKVVVIIVTVLLVRESRQKRDGDRATWVSKTTTSPRDLGMFRTKSFVALATATLTLGLVVAGTGVFRTLFPVQAELAAGLNSVEIGNLIAIAGFFALVGAVPFGILADRLGRKPLIIAGMIMTALAVWLMAGTTTFLLALAAVVVLGMAEAVGTGTVQVYAIDLAPDDRRGSFLGVWALFQNLGQIIGPLLIGGIADLLGFATAFYVVTVILLVGASIVLVLAKETHDPKTQAQ